MERKEFEQLLEQTVENLVQIRSESKKWLNDTSWIIFSSVVDRARIAVDSLHNAIRSKTMPQRKQKEKT